MWGGTPIGKGGGGGGVTTAVLSPPCSMDTDKKIEETIRKNCNGFLPRYKIQLQSSIDLLVYYIYVVLLLLSPFIIRVILQYNLC